MSVQLNVRTTPVLIDELDKVVNKGLFRNRTEAVNEALRLLVKRYRMMELEQKMDRIAKDNVGKKSVTESLLESREEDD
jgi:Arc/MetJ-type ribon-helix-helix transcriptional regulator